MAEESHSQTIIASVKTDSRTVEKGDLFFCVSGDNFDGHEFAAQAVKQGAVAVVASRMIDDVDAPILMVRDTVNALGRLAACWRDICGAKLVAVTGTAGKTTVKEMLYAVASEKFETAKNYRNFNNQIGLPLSMLKATVDQELWIMELGISHRGDMEELAPIASPDIAVITNVGPGHLEGLGNEAGVAQAKSVLLRYLRQPGSAIISKDYPLLWDAARELVDMPVGFSTNLDAKTDFVATFLGPGTEGNGRFRLTTPDGDGEFEAPFCGEHYAENLACVAAVAHALGLNRDAVIRGVQSLEPDTQRFCCKRNGNLMVIDDTYNANPLSMQRSIQTAADMADGKPLALILGDMRELGDETRKHHEALGRTLREIEPTIVFYKGDHFNAVAQAYGKKMHKIDTREDFVHAWQSFGAAKGVALVKGSRSLEMEHFVSALCAGRTEDAQGGNQ
nr:UDP-N-acetylmuramoyl-tripeptide--D-alanyl-D-alanine ligase [Pseudodesulfovibrio sp. JC047]